MLINQITLFFPSFFLPKGATIKRDEHTGAIVVARIMRGGAADRSGNVLMFDTSHSGVQNKMR